MFGKLVIIASLLFVSCGIEEYYYLPQIPESNISRSLNTEAVINIPPIPEEFYYASHYAIFYRIYISDFLTSSSTEINQISPTLASDFNWLYQFANPANTTSITTSSTFRARNYFELEFDEVEISSVLTTEGGTLRILFPTMPGSFPVIYFNDGAEVRLSRSSTSLISPVPSNDMSFRSTSELRNNANATAQINADVAGRAGASLYTYVSMYIVAVGVDPGNFTPVFSKPTHISVFKLPDSN